MTSPGNPMTCTFMSSRWCLVSIVLKNEFYAVYRRSDLEVESVSYNKVTILKSSFKEKTVFNLRCIAELTEELYEWVLDGNLDSWDDF